MVKHKINKSELYWFMVALLTIHGPWPCFQSLILDFWIALRILKTIGTDRADGDVLYIMGWKWDFKGKGWKFYDSMIGLGSKLPRARYMMAYFHCQLDWIYNDHGSTFLNVNENVSWNILLNQDLPTNGLLLQTEWNRESKVNSNPNPSYWTMNL